MAALFEFDEVKVVRDGTTVLDGVTLGIPGNGITVVVGASGSGKSTLLRCCNRLESPSAGRVAYRGDDLRGVDPLTLRRRVAMVFQTPTVFAGTALDNLRAAEPATDTAAAEALLTRVGLPPDLLDRDADTLSGGEAQRLCLARALATRPEALLADEPTSALDHEATDILERLALDLATDDMPIVWVTHDRAQVRRLADHVVELDHGRITFAGPARDRRQSDEESA